MTDQVTHERDEDRGGGMLADMSNAVVSLHKQQFGRGPTQARCAFATDDVLVCVLENSLLPAERALTELGEQLRVQESRLFFQHATRDAFIRTAERIVGRPVRSFTSATDPLAEMVFEIFAFEPR